MESVILKEMNSLLLPCNPASLFLNATEATCDLKRHTKLTEWTQLQHTCLYSSNLPFGSFYCF